MPNCAKNVGTSMDLNKSNTFHERGLVGGVFGVTTLFWLIVFLGTAFALIYRRVDLRLSTAAMGAVLVAYTLFAGAPPFGLFLLWVLFGGLILLNVETLRRERISAPILGVLRSLLPRLSETERAALEAGTVWWEGELFSGMPDWQQLAKLPPPRLTEAEQAFLDGPTEELCSLADEWQITHELQDMPESLWGVHPGKRFLLADHPERIRRQGIFLACGIHGPGQACLAQRHRLDHGGCSQLARSG